MKTKIVVIEDDPGVQDIVTAYFRPKGFDIKTYLDGESVIADIKAKKLEADVFVIDLGLPDISGLDLIRKIKKANFEGPIISITAKNSVELALEAIEAGAYDFFIKPLYFPQLLISIQRALRIQTTTHTKQLLKDGPHTDTEFGEDRIICVSNEFKRVIELAKKVSNYNTSVFISGESGVGKEVVARTIHHASPRRKYPFIAINCSAIPEHLLESELFGHAKGSFTGATDHKVGLFEAAAGGTFLLDEISDLSLPLQAKLLRVLQERKIKRVGENQFRDINVRIISATHHDLRKQVEENKFREDLYFRLSVMPIHILPLRERKDDLIPLAEFFIEKFARLNRSKTAKLTVEAIEKIRNHSWPGNVRELENTIERAMVLSQGQVITENDLFDMNEPLHKEAEKGQELKHHISINRDRILPISEVVNMYIQNVLEKNGGAKEKTAKDLGIDRKTLYHKLNEISKANFPAHPNGESVAGF